MQVPTILDRVYNELNPEDVMYDIRRIALSSASPCRIVLNEMATIHDHGCVESELQGGIHCDDCYFGALNSNELRNKIKKLNIKKLGILNA
jgi:hypothetical protein